QEYVAWLDAYPICGDISMTPDDYPIEVMPGGSFGYTGHLGNSTAYQQELDVWIMLETPGYGSYGPVNRVMDIPIESGQSLSYHFIQHVPNFAPAGEYEYIAYCGEYPDNTCNQTSFNFTVIPDRKPGGLDDWYLQGSWSGTSQDKTSLSLSAHPNPFNATTTITYNLTGASYVSLDVYNLLGQKVAALVDEYQNASIYSVNWDASEQASGIYYYKLAIDEKSVTGRLTLLK
ncbi:MAG: T9SS type A sorting domain-containing protein, partial [candidate division Zixibacteria bacterium]|nr:T9SS type A sorting domain-containing protein [candidate division Zixibacteria bacterium]